MEMKVPSGAGTTPHTDASYKHLGDVISKNDKPNYFFLRKLSKPHINYNITEKKLILIVECLKQFRENVFG